MSVNSRYGLKLYILHFRCHEFKMSYGTQYCYELTLISESLKGPRRWCYLRFLCFRTGDVYIMGLLHFHSCINLGELLSYSNRGELCQSSSDSWPRSLMFFRYSNPFYSPSSIASFTQRRLEWKQWLEALSKSTKNRSDDSVTKCSIKTITLAWRKQFRCYHNKHIYIYTHRPLY